MNEKSIDKNHEKTYTEACNTLRHYSTASYNVRALLIVQGLVLLGVWATQFSTGHKVMFFIPGAGIVFTVLLFFFHKGYFDAASFFYQVAGKMEEQLFDEGFRPIEQYRVVRARKYKGLLSQAGIIYAPFSFVGGLFIAALIFAFCCK